MKKRIKFGVFVVLLIFVLSSCAKEAVEYPWPIGAESELAFDSDVTMTLIEDTLTPTQASVLLRNQGIEPVDYGRDFCLQIQLDEIWYDIEVGWGGTAEAFPLEPGEEVELLINWNLPYGALPKGKYRIIKSVSLDNSVWSGERMENLGIEKYVACEFTIT